MSDDLVKRLRSMLEGDMRPSPLGKRAADCIEELEAKLAKAVAERDEALNQLDSARHSVEVLLKRVAKLKGQDDAS